MASLVAAVLLTASVTAGALAQAKGQPVPFPGQGRGAFTNTAIFNGAQLEHVVPGGTETLAQPDDITFLDGHIFVAFQNGVGPQGQPSTSTGNTRSTIVELDLGGNPLAQWDLAGKCDGLSADPGAGELIATVNEDANSSLYTIDPQSGAIVHYSYNEPLPSDGGTDAITIHDGMILVSASAPGTTGAAAPQPTYPAVYEVALDPATQIATITALFYDEATAALANVGSPRASVMLGLTDPDSNENVPFYARRFAGDFMLTSQGDQQQIFVAGAGGPRQALSVLNLSTAVDDSAWPSSPGGALYVTDNGNDTVNRIVGAFSPGSALVAATPCDSNLAPSTCPGPGFPPDYLGRLNPWTGAIRPIALGGAPVEPHGMLFVP
jgi:hypothetical protein